MRIVLLLYRKMSLVSMLDMMAQNISATKKTVTSHTFGLLMSALGAEVELQNNPNEVIAISTAAGLDFLNF